MPSRISAYVMALIRKRVCARCAENHSSTSGSGRGRINSDRTLVSSRMRAQSPGAPFGRTARHLPRGRRQHIDRDRRESAPYAARRIKVAIPTP